MPPAYEEAGGSTRSASAVPMEPSVSVGTLGHFHAPRRVRPSHLGPALPEEDLRESDDCQSGPSGLGPEGSSTSVAARSLHSVADAATDALGNGSGFLSGMRDHTLPTTGGSMPLRPGARPDGRGRGKTSEEGSVSPAAGHAPSPGRPADGGKYDCLLAAVRHMQLPSYTCRGLRRDGSKAVVVVVPHAKLVFVGNSDGVWLLAENCLIMAKAWYGDSLVRACGEALEPSATKGRAGGQGSSLPERGSDAANASSETGEAAQAGARVLGLSLPARAARQRPSNLVRMTLVESGTPISLNNGARKRFRQLADPTAAFVDTQWARMAQAQRTALLDLVHRSSVAQDHSSSLWGGRPTGTLPLHLQTDAVSKIEQKQRAAASDKTVRTMGATRSAAEVAHGGQQIVLRVKLLEAPHLCYALLAAGARVEGGPATAALRSHCFYQRHNRQQLMQGKLPRWRLPTDQKGGDGESGGDVDLTHGESPLQSVDALSRGEARSRTPSPVGSRTAGAQAFSPSLASQPMHQYPMRPALLVKPPPSAVDARIRRVSARGGAPGAVGRNRRRSSAASLLGGAVSLFSKPFQFESTHSIPVLPQNIQSEFGVRRRFTRLDEGMRMTDDDGQMAMPSDLSGKATGADLGLPSPDHGNVLSAGSFGIVVRAKVDRPQEGALDWARGVPLDRSGWLAARGRVDSHARSSPFEVPAPEAARAPCLDVGAGGLVASRGVGLTALLQTYAALEGLTGPGIKGVWHTNIMKFFGVTVSSRSDAAVPGLWVEAAPSWRPSFEPAPGYISLAETSIASMFQNARVVASPDGQRATATGRRGNGRSADGARSGSISGRSVVGGSSASHGVKFSEALSTAVLSAQIFNAVRALRASGLTARTLSPHSFLVRPLGGCWEPSNPANRAAVDWSQPRLLSDPSVECTIHPPPVKNADTGSLSRRRWESHWGSSAHGDSGELPFLYVANTLLGLGVCPPVSTASTASLGRTPWGRHGTESAQNLWVPSHVMLHVMLFDLHHACPASAEPLIEQGAACPSAVCRPGYIAPEVFEMASTPAKPATPDGETHSPPPTSSLLCTGLPEGWGTQQLAGCDSLVSTACGELVDQRDASAARALRSDVFSAAATVLSGLHGRVPVPGVDRGDVVRSNYVALHYAPNMSWQYGTRSTVGSVGFDRKRQNRKLSRGLRLGAGTGQSASLEYLGGAAPAGELLAPECPRGGSGVSASRGSALGTRVVLVGGLRNHLQGGNRCQNDVGSASKLVSSQLAATARMREFESEGLLRDMVDDGSVCRQLVDSLQRNLQLTPREPAPLLAAQCDLLCRPMRRVIRESLCLAPELRPTVGEVCERLASALDSLSRHGVRAPEEPGTWGHSSLATQSVMAHSSIAMRSAPDRNRGGATASQSEDHSSMLLQTVAGGPGATGVGGAPPPADRPGAPDRPGNNSRLGTRLRSLVGSARDRAAFFAGGLFRSRRHLFDVPWWRARLALPAHSERVVLLNLAVGREEWLL